MASPSFCNKYKVLKPQPSIAALSKSFHSIPNCKYLLASTNDWSVRKYRQHCTSIDQLLSVAEWRYEAIPQIAHSYFLQLLKPNALLKNVEYEVYLEHMQLALAEMKKLIAQESFYLMIQSAKGYQQLISKFKKASVNASTIGLNEHGRCIVWHSSELNAFLPSLDAVSKQNDLIVAIIQIVKQRSEPFCQGMLSRLIEEVKRKNFSFQNFIQHLYAITLTMKITIPQDLKYLVNQNKILKNVQSIKVKTQAVEPSKNRAVDTKTQRFCPVKTQSRQNSFRGTLGKPQDKRVHRLSDANMLKGIRVTSSLSSKRFVTEKDITHKKQSYLSTNMSSFIASSDKKWNVLRNRSKCTDEEGESNQFNFSKSRQRTVISKCKSSEGRSPSNINIIYARPFDRLIFSENDPVDCLQQERHSMGYGHNSQYSDRANSLRQKQFVPSQTTKIYKSFVIDFGKPIINEKNRCIGEECQEHQSSPNKQKSDESEQSVNRSKAEEESAAQEVIKANQWTKNVDSHSLWVQAKLNASIDLGEERRSYLDDVKLQKLEMLSRQMAISRLPEDSAQQLYSQTLIMQ